MFYKVCFCCGKPCYDGGICSGCWLCLDCLDMFEDFNVSE